MTFLPSALRRIEQARPAGYVVAILNPGSIVPRHLTCADVMDQETAEREAGEWRKRAAAMGGPRYLVCAVVPVEQRGEV